MSTDSRAPDDKDLDRWLAGLAGDDGADDPIAEKLRETVSRQHQQFEGEIDELRLRRGRAQLIKSVREQESLNATSRRASPWAIAASVAMVAAASLIGYELYITGPDPADIELIMSYGDLERPRGGFPTIEIDVEDPLQRGQAIGQQLTEAGIPFELRRIEDTSYQIAVSVGEDNQILLLQETLGEEGTGIVGPGYYVIDIE